MISAKEAKKKYRGCLRVAVHHARKGRLVLARHFYAMAQGIVACIGVHSINIPRLQLVGWIVGTVSE